MEERVINALDRISGAMRHLTWIFALLMLTLFFNRWLDRQHNPNQALSVSASASQPLVLKQNRQGHYIATGMINGSPVVFLLDTGATTMSIPAGVANQLGLKRLGTASVSTANGTATVYPTQLDAVQLGHIVIEDVRGHINPHMGGNTALLGMSFLKHLDLRQRGDTLTITIPDGTL